MKLFIFINRNKFYYGYSTVHQSGNLPIEPRDYTGSYDFARLKFDRIDLLRAEVNDYFGRGFVKFVPPTIKGDLLDNFPDLKVMEEILGLKVRKVGALNDVNKDLLVEGIAKGLLELQHGDAISRSCGSEITVLRDLVFLSTIQDDIYDYYYSRLGLSKVHEKWFKSRLKLYCKTSDLLQFDFPKTDPYQICNLVRTIPVHIFFSIITTRDKGLDQIRVFYLNGENTIVDDVFNVRQFYNSFYYEYTNFLSLLPLLSYGIHLLLFDDSLYYYVFKNDDITNLESYSFINEWWSASIEITEDIFNIDAYRHAYSDSLEYFEGNLCSSFQKFHYLYSRFKAGRTNLLNSIYRLPFDYSYDLFYDIFKKENQYLGLYVNDERRKMFDSESESDSSDSNSAEIDAMIEEELLINPERRYYLSEKEMIKRRKVARSSRINNDPNVLISFLNEKVNRLEKTIMFKEDRLDRISRSYFSLHKNYDKLNKRLLRGPTRSEYFKTYQGNMERARRLVEGSRLYVNTFIQREVKSVVDKMINFICFQSFRESNLGFEFLIADIFDEIAKESINEERELELNTEEVSVDTIEEKVVKHRSKLDVNFKRDRNKYLLNCLNDSGSYDCFHCGKTNLQIKTIQNHYKKWYEIGHCVVLTRKRKK